MYIEMLRLVNEMSCFRNPFKRWRYYGEKGLCLNNCWKLAPFKNRYVVCRDKSVVEIREVLAFSRVFNLDKSYECGYPTVCVNVNLSSILIPENNNEPR